MVNYNIHDVEAIVKEFYPICGSEICMEKTGLTRNQIYYIVKKLKLKIINLSDLHLKQRSSRRTIFDPEPFLKINTKEVAYLLGFLWADGSFGSKKQCSISMEIIKQDMDKIKSVIISTGNWNFRTRQRNDWQPVTCASINNRKLYNFLLDNDYGIKSTASPDKILSIIPENLKHCFFRGLIDGDGCFYVNEKQYLYQFSITSTINQNWAFFTEKLNDLNVKYDIKHIERINDKSGNMNSYSCLRVTNKNEILKLGNYIYSDFESNHMGLVRKYEKFNLIKIKSLKTKPNGIYEKPNGKFEAYFLLGGGKRKYIGIFSSKEEAINTQRNYKVL